MNPEQRRKVQKSLLELESLKVAFQQCNAESESSENRVEIEQDKLNKLSSAVENAYNDLSIAQEEIDATPLPEGAQPKARIQNRDDLQLVRFTRNSTFSTIETYDYIYKYRERNNWKRK
jgi:hypothetical protein